MPNIVELIVTKEDLALPAIANYSRPSKEDYCHSYKLSGTSVSESIGTCQIHGGRETQEDFIAIGVNEVAQFAELNAEANYYALDRTFRTLQELYGQSGSGTTACAGFGWAKDGIVNYACAHLGDSSFFRISLDKEDKVIFCERLNNLHRPSDPSEKERIESMGGTVTKKRIYSGTAGLAMSRAFGDNEFKEKGLSHVPQILTRQFKQEAEAKEFLMVCSDGADDGITEEQLGKIISANANEKIALIACKIVEEAYQNSRDNISVALVRVGNIPVSVLVADGHRGKKVAENISNHFYSTLKADLAFVSSSKDLEKLRLESLEFRKCENLFKEKMAIKKNNIGKFQIQFQKWVTEFKQNKDFHVFVRLFREKFCELIFASTDRYVTVTDQLEKLGKTHEVPGEYGHGYFGDEHPSNRYTLTYTWDDTFPAEDSSLFKFIAEVKVLLTSAIAFEVDSKISTAPHAALFSSVVNIPTDAKSISSSLSLSMQQN